MNCSMTENVLKLGNVRTFRFRRLGEVFGDIAMSYHLSTCKADYGIQVGRRFLSFTKI